MSSTPLIFVYKGKKWPKYASHSLRIALKTAEVPVVVLTNLPPIATVPHVKWVSLSDFYDKSDFKEFERDSSLPLRIRDGFWYHTVERFFILREFARISGLKSFFHGELDCLFLGLNNLEDQINGSGLSGFFFPRETESRGMGSLVFVNDFSALALVCDHFKEYANLGTPDASLGNEMHLLGLLPHSTKYPFYALPSAERLFRSESNEPWPISESYKGTIIDGAVIGRWLFGMDPENTNGAGTKNLIQAHPQLVPFDFPLSLLEFRFGGEDWSLEVRHRRNRNWYPVAAIHVHSKIHEAITPAYFRRVVQSANRGKSTRIVPPTFEYRLEKLRRIFRHLYFLATSRKVRQDQINRIRRYLRIGT